MSEKTLRLGVRSAASVLLIASGVHGVAHYRAFVDEATFDASRRALMGAMRAYVVLPRWHVDAWTMLRGYSLSFAILLMLSGTLLWWLGRELAPRRLRALATATLLILIVAVALLGVAGPMPVQMAILALAALCLTIGIIAGRHGTDDNGGPRPTL